MTVYSYCRFSELEQEEGPESLEVLAQREMLKIRNYCLGRQWFLAETLEDMDVSWNVDFACRENGSRLLELLRPGDVVVTSSLERVFSSSHDAASTLEAFKQRGVGLHIVQLGGDVTDAQFLVNFERVARMLSGLERRRSAERIKRVKKKQRSKGRYLGGSRPFGYMIHENGRLIENPVEQRVLKRIIQLKKEGKSLRAISKEVSTPMAPVSFKTVQRLLQRRDDQL
jgi:DNA invertase Pin-like site-specific DNA recombinase